MTERLTIDVSGHVATVTLNRPDKYNAIDNAMFEAFAGIADRIAERPEIRAVVLTGAGENFCAGIDLSVFQGKDPGASIGDRFEAEANSPANFIQMPAYAWQEIPVPVIAAVHGFVLGGGIGMSGAADIIVACEDASFGLPEIDRGALGAATHLMRMFPMQKVRRMLYTGEPIRAPEAYRFGSIEAVVSREELLPTAHELAQKIAEKSPKAMRLAKESLNGIELIDVKKSYRFEQGFTLELYTSPDSQEARSAFVEKRKAEFKDTKK